LAHGDFAGRNMIVLPVPDGLALVVFDWEMAGWGPPAVDLAEADLTLYGSLGRGRWPALAAGSLSRAGVGGRLLYGGLASCAWAVPDVLTEWVVKPITTLAFYDAQVEQSLRSLRWVPL